MTIYKQWLDVFKEPVWTMRDFSDGIVWDKGQVSIFQSGHSEYTVITHKIITRITAYWSIFTDWYTYLMPITMLFSGHSL